MAVGRSRTLRRGLFEVRLIQNSIKQGLVFYAVERLPKASFLPWTISLGQIRQH